MSKVFGQGQKALELPKEEQITKQSTKKVKIKKKPKEAKVVEEMPEITETYRKSAQPKLEDYQFNRLWKSRSAQRVVGVRETEETVIRRISKQKPKKSNIIEELPEVIETAEIVIKDAKSKKHIKKVRKIAEKDGDLQKTIGIINMDGDEQPETTVTIQELPEIAEVVVKPVDIKLPEAIEVREITTEIGKPKKRTKKVPKRGNFEKITEIVIIEDEVKKPKDVVRVKELPEAVGSRW
ncbi:hypothetical protein ILUMI_23117 [Ignelater luminosus]|uniref:Titin n=1 Tax=Ignelater luminosus TaxID=2038154 RepID=A0A8K0C8P9_IGNLU|nr:hypothetical protein ILUMI_23117 [Ignelater luminosus]